MIMNSKVCLMMKGDLLINASVFIPLTCTHIHDRAFYTAVAAPRIANYRINHQDWHSMTGTESFYLSFPSAVLRVCHHGDP